MPLHHSALQRVFTRIRPSPLCLPPGASYAFSAAAAVESLRAIKKNQLYNLSPQQIIDCSADEGNFGCFQGQVDWALEHIKKRGITYENKYPYLGEGSRGCGLTKVREGQGQQCWPASHADCTGEQ